MRLKPALVLLFLCVITGGLLAQSRKSFTHEPEAFVKELSDMLNASRKKVGKQFVEDEFGPVFLGLEYSDAMRKRPTPWATPCSRPKCARIPSLRLTCDS